MTDHDKRIVELSYRESPASHPSFGLEVLVPVALLTIAAYVAVWTVYGVPLARFTAAVVCSLVMVWRLYLWDTQGRAVHITEHKRYVDEPEPRPQIRPAMIDERNHRWSIGKLSFTESEWRRLAEALREGRVTRDLLSDLERDNGERMFSNVTARYSEYLTELQRLGWIDAENAVQDVAWDWLGERGLALPPGASSAEIQR